MALPPRSFYTIYEAALRWGVMPTDVIGWALDGHLNLAAALPPVRAGSSMLAGLCVIEAADIFRLFRRDGGGPGNVPIRRARENGEGETVWITEPAEGVPVTPADVLIPRAELERFEQEYAPLGEEPSGPPRAAGRRPGPGAPARYDWDAFYGALLRRVYHEGLPASQSELVREMQDWFDDRDPGGQGGPDESTIRRKVQAIWREFER